MSVQLHNSVLHGVVSTSKIIALLSYGLCNIENHLRDIAWWLPQQSIILLRFFIIACGKVPLVPIGRLLAQDCRPSPGCGRRRSSCCPWHSGDCTSLGWRKRQRPCHIRRAGVRSCRLGPCTEGSDQAHTWTSSRSTCKDTSSSWIGCLLNQNISKKCVIVYVALFTRIDVVIRSHDIEKNRAWKKMHVLHTHKL